MGTTDGGHTWQGQHILGETYLAQLSKVDVIDARHGWCVGTYGTIIATSNGEEWVVEQSGTQRELAGVSFVDAGHGWVVGKGGVILEDPSPICYAPSACTVQRGRTAVLKYKVADAAVVKLTVTIRIKNSRNAQVKKIVLTGRPPNRLLSTKFVCKLPRGKYRFFVYAVDSAGNRAAVPAINKLTVK